MLYLPMAWVLGPNGTNAIHLHVVNHASVAEEVTKAIILHAIHEWPTE
jgi:hypothetical protein